jgi:uroporphyrinogen-III synthase
MGEEKGLGGCRIVVTRPAEQAAELVEPLRRLGAIVRQRPLVAIAPPADPAALQGALAALDSFRWIAFTSANAVRACAACAPSAVRWPAVACVGAGTARAAAAAGMTVALVPDDFSGEGLARALVQTGVAGERVLWPRASGAREMLASVLRAAGADVIEVECYRTLPDVAAAVALAGELRDHPADVLVFTSPSAVRACAAAAGPSPTGAVAVIGEVTGGAARAAGWSVQVRPGEQSIPGLVMALAEWWQSPGR